MISAMFPWSTGAASSTGVTPAGRNQVDVELPTAAQAGSTSVEVSLSPQGQSMLNIDMASLASKGYKSVNIDTDGRPGAEVSISVNGDAGNVVLAAGNIPVGAPDAVQRLRELVEAGDAADKLLAAFAKSGLDEQQTLSLVELMLQLMQELTGDSEDASTATGEQSAVEALLGLSR